MNSPVSQEVRSVPTFCGFRPRSMIFNRQLAPLLAPTHTEQIMKRKDGGTTLRRISHEIGEEAVRQLLGFRDELRRQTTRGWGEEFALQIFGAHRQPRRRR